MSEKPIDTVSVCTDEVGNVEHIPVRNLWLLMLYASSLLRELGKDRVSIEDNPDDIPNLIAELLCYRVEERIRRNLSFGYQLCDDVLNRVRGRINLLKTETHQLLNKGKVACHFHELSINTVCNRYVRSALEQIANIANRDNLPHQCRVLASYLRRQGVTGTCPSRQETAANRFGWQDVGDKRMFDIAQLAFDLALPTEDPGDRHLTRPPKDIEWLRNLFEKAVAGFYEVTLNKKGYRVIHGTPLDWQMEQMTPGINAYFPSMKTDIVIERENPGHRIVIDTKFTSILKKGFYRELTFRSSYIYQIYAYLMSQQGNGDVLSDNATGVLLHPSIDQTVNESVVVQGHRLKFVTVDFMATAQEIRSQLLEVIADAAPLLSVG